MSVEAVIYAKTTSTGAINALVGSRVYPIEAPQSPTLPYIVYHRIDTNYIDNLVAATNLETARMQLDCYAADKSGALALASAVKTGLRRSRGVMGGVTVDDMVIESVQSDYEPQVGLVRYIVDVTVWYREATS